MHPAEVSVESRLCVEGFLAALDRTLEPLWLAVDGLDVHQEVVAHAEPTATLFALGGGGGVEEKVES